MEGRDSPVTVWYDALGREIQKDTYGLNTRKIIVNTEYYTDGANKGKVYRVAEPHFEGEPYNWAAIYSYNATYGYAEYVTTPVGTTHTTPVKLTTSVTSPEGTSSTVTNAAGQALASTVNGKKVSYEYYPNGLTKSTTPEGGQALTMKYNLQGKRTSLVDPDGGTTRTEYNGWGELTKEVQLIHLNHDSIITINRYDSIGRLSYINRNNEITTYSYDTNNKSRVNSIAITGKNTQTFEFDDLDRVTKVTETITANGTTKAFVSGKEYDALGRVKKEIYPSQYYTVNTYDRYSNLTEIRDEVGSGHSIWKANIENALGQATSIFKGTKETTSGYDPVNHQTTSIYAAGVVNYTYGYDSKNNLSWRKDNLISNNIQQEDFGYDELNRLISWKVTHGGIQTPYGIAYDLADNPANIKTKSGIETEPDHLLTMYYGGRNPNGTTTGRPDGSNIGPHALSTISGVPASPFPQTDLTVTYTDFKKIATLHEGSKDYELTYGVDDQRRMSGYYANGKSQGASLTRYYVGNYEEEIYPDGKVRKIHYLSGAILIQNDGKADSLLYTYSDAQGSLIALTDADGNLVRRYAYDPWGVRRDADNWNAKDNGAHLIVNRGYTGHEHLDAFGIINMNGRVYDPYTAQFFSPDPHVQAPGDWLNYNRYAYCSGNPFRYTDPSGELQIGPFYISVNIGWSPNGGLSFGISAGVGLENIASVGLSIGFGAKYGNFSFTVNAGLDGAYAYAGYDTKGGWMAGAGISYISAFSIWSPVSINTNIFGVGIDYSEHGGLSGNFLGASISGAGVSFNPSIGVGLTLQQTIEEYKTGEISTEEYEQLLENAEDYYSDEYVNDYDNALKSRIKSTFNGFEEGDAGVAVITTKTKSYGMDAFGNYVNSKGEVIGGYYTSNIFGRHGQLHISSATRSSGDINFKAVVGHEIIHAVHHFNMGSIYNRAKSERVAYEYTASVFEKNGLLISAYSALNTVHMEFPSAYSGLVPSNYSLTLNRFISF